MLIKIFDTLVIMYIKISYKLLKDGPNAEFD